MNFNNVYFEKAFGTSAQFTESDLPEFCFSGRSNVGKSSLINKLVGRKSLARVSGKPGKTVTVNFYRADKLRIVDLPGYGYAKVPFAERDRWSDLCEGYFKMGRDIRMVFALIDMRHPPSAHDMAMLDFLYQTETPYTVVLTKSDKLNRGEYAERMQKIYDELGDYALDTEVIPFSAQTGEGVERLAAIIEGEM